MCGLDSGSVRSRNQHVLPTKALAARIHELACTQKNLNPGSVPSFCPSFFHGLLSFASFFAARFWFSSMRFCVSRFPFSVPFAQRLAVFFTSVVISSPFR